MILANLLSNEQRAKVIHAEVAKMEDVSTAPMCPFQHLANEQWRVDPNP